MAEFVDYLLGQPQSNITHFKSDLVAGCRTDNCIKLAGVAAGSNPSVRAVGNDTNISFNLVPKGSGGVAVPTGDLVVTTGDLYQSTAGAKQVIGGTAEGGALVNTTKIISKTGIVENTLTTVATVAVPNVATACAFRCWFMAWISGADTGVVVLDSARTGEFFVIVTRQAGVAAVAAIIPVECSATNAVTNVNQLVTSQIATIASGATFTTVFALGAITGAANVAETFTIQVTNDASTGAASTTNVLLKVEAMNVGAGGVSIS